MTTDSRVDAAALTDDTVTDEATSEAPPGTEFRPCRDCGEQMAMTKNRRYTGRRHRARGLCTACCTKASRAGTLDQYPRLNRERDDVVAAYHEFMTKNPRATMREAAVALNIPRSSLSMTLARDRRARKADPVELAAS